jgi:hypothetical protein
VLGRGRSIESDVLGPLQRFLALTQNQNHPQDGARSMEARRDRSPHARTRVTHGARRRQRARQ